MSIDTSDISLDWERLTKRAPRHRQIYLAMAKQDDHTALIPPSRIWELVPDINDDYVRGACLVMKKKGLLETDGDGGYRIITSRIPQTRDVQSDVQEISPEKVVGIAYKGTDERSGDDDKTVTTMDLHAYLSDLVESQVDEDMAMEIIQEGGDVQFTVTELLKRVAGVRCRIKLIAVIERIGEIAPLKDDKGLPAKSE